MDELIPWLHRRLSEDERKAQDMAHLPPCASWADQTCDCGLAERKNRALREVEAKQRMLRIHGHPYCDWCADGGHEGDDGKPCLHLALLALPFEQQPGYQERWRP